MRVVRFSLVAILTTGTLTPVLLKAQQAAVWQMQLTRFDLQSSAIVTAPGDSLSNKQYSDKNYWFPVKVPSTVLTGLVANHVYPSPYIGMNNMMIPDASDSFNHQWGLEKYSFLPNEANPWKKPYWYRTVFQVPASAKGKYFQLIFKGINYRAEVWLNGSLIADSAQMAGMFAQYSLNVTDHIHAGSDNVLAVKIYPLDYPGLPSHPQINALGPFYANGGPTGDIGKNVTMLCSIGWDWMPAVRDRNIGIWQPVYLRATGPVVIRHPHIVTTLPALPETNLARIALHLSLANYSNQHQDGRLKVTISPATFPGAAINLEQAVSLEPGTSRHLDLTADRFAQLVIHNPHLWWPNGYGKPELYRLRLQYIHGSQVSDDTSFLFGIRTVSSQVVNVNGWPRRDFYVNGKWIHLLGGAWVPDMMLNRDSARYDNELRLCRNGNVNLVRIWGGGIAPPDIFFDLADRYGLLVWQDFWITGDTQGQFKGSDKWPIQGNIFIRNMVSTINRLRNHPSLLVWTGGNEGHARKELYDAMRKSISTLDGTRPFIPSSSGYARLPAGWKGSWPDNQPSGVYSGGPYSWQDEARYYQLVDRGRDWVFKDETGIPSQVPYSDLSRVIPDLVPDTTLPFPLNNTWGYHDACVGNGHYDLYYQAMVNRYGSPLSVKDFSSKMQLMNATGYQAIFESVGHKLNETGGVMLWKLNAAFPSVIWQVYDWFLVPNAGYYFMQNACEPLHVQLNLDDSAVAVVNRTFIPYRGLRIEATGYSPEGQTLFHRSARMDMDSTGATEAFSLDQQLATQQGIIFLVLNVNDGEGKLISHNVYWMAPGHDFRDLAQMPHTGVTVKLVRTVRQGAHTKLMLKFSNPSHQLAFFIHAALQSGGKELLPSFWSTNYFSLAPGESLLVQVSCASDKLSGRPVDLSMEGWNVHHQLLPISVVNR
ncbi:MAG TPA: glycoside hydrolase family 2 TIM barrel-domain containing protein [Chitinophagaceae bacterium]|nr:glycoside hydrolase family 2 TIM barrel-domain containing protein [Chitinophagaceae bacterium]